MKTAPPPIKRCPLDRFCWERKLALADLGDAWGCSHEQARLIQLPFGHPDRRIPSADLIERIYAWSGGAIGPADHYPPRPIKNGEAEPDMARAVLAGGGAP